MASTPFTPFFVQAADVALDPTELRAGDSWAWLRYFAEYPPSAGWTLQYVLNSPAARFAVPLATATSDGLGFQVSVAAAQTANVSPGQYDLYAVLATAGAQQTFLVGRVLVTANILGATGAVDTRSFVKKTLDILEAAMLGDASPLVQEYEIHGRRVQYMNRLQLKQLRDQFKAEYRQERIAAGEYVPKRRLGITFTEAY